METRGLAVNDLDTGAESDRPWRECSVLQRTSRCSLQSGDSYLVADRVVAFRRSTGAQEYDFPADGSTTTWRFRMADLQVVWSYYILPIFYIKFTDLIIYFTCVP